MFPGEVQLHLRLVQSVRQADGGFRLRRQLLCRQGDGIKIAQRQAQKPPSDKKYTEENENDEQKWGKALGALQNII